MDDIERAKRNVEDANEKLESAKKEVEEAERDLREEEALVAEKKAKEAEEIAMVNADALQYKKIKFKSQDGNFYTFEMSVLKSSA